MVRIRKPIEFPAKVFVGNFRQDGRTALTARPKTARAWRNNGALVVEYVPPRLDPVHQELAPRKKSLLARFAYWLLEKAE